MSDINNDNRVIQCPFCKEPITVEELGGSSDLYLERTIWG